MENNLTNSENDSSFGFSKESNPGKRNVFITPANYFDKLPLEIADKIHAGGNSSSVFNFSLPRFIGVTALVAIVIAGSVFWYSDQNANKVTNPVLTYDDILNSELVGDMDEKILFEVYFKSTQLGSNLTAQSESEAQAFENYLIENNTDITLLINEL